MEVIYEDLAKIEIKEFKNSKFEEVKNEINNKLSDYEQKINSLLSLGNKKSKVNLANYIEKYEREERYIQKQEKLKQSLDEIEEANSRTIKPNIDKDLSIKHEVSPIKERVKKKVLKPLPSTLEIILKEKDKSKLNNYINKKNNNRSVGMDEIYDHANKFELKRIELMAKKSYENLMNFEKIKKENCEMLGHSIEYTSNKMIEIQNANSENAEKIKKQQELIKNNINRKKYSNILAKNHRELLKPSLKAKEPKINKTKLTTLNEKKSVKVIKKPKPKEFDNLIEQTGYKPVNILKPLDVLPNYLSNQHFVVKKQDLESNIRSWDKLLSDEDISQGIELINERVKGIDEKVKLKKKLLKNSNNNSAEINEEMANLITDSISAKLAILGKISKKAK